MDFPTWLNTAIEQDAYVFVWKSNPTLDTNTIGSKERAGKYISKAATHLPISKGGAGSLNWKAHTKAFQAMWNVSYMHPRIYPWKNILMEWIPFPPSITVNATGKEKKQILNNITKGHHLIYKSFKSVWSLKLRMDRDSLNRVSPDHLLAFPIFQNPVLKIRKHLQHEWSSHPKLPTLLTLLYTDGKFRSQKDIKKRIEELAPTTTNKGINRLLSHAKSIQSRIPTWFIEKLTSNHRSWQDGEIVAMVDEENEMQYCQIIKQKLYQLRLDASGHGKQIGSTWDMTGGGLDSKLIKVAVWGSRKPPGHTSAIRGLQNETYPPNEGWITPKGKTIKL
eukprot:6212938-Pleurochrysis_carterae.AAC.8